MSKEKGIFRKLQSSVQHMHGIVTAGPVWSLVLGLFVTGLTCRHKNLDLRRILMSMWLFSCDKSTAMAISSQQIRKVGTVPVLTRGCENLNRADTWDSVLWRVTRHSLLRSGNCLPLRKNTRNKTGTACACANGSKQDILKNEHTNRLSTEEDMKMLFESEQVLQAYLMTPFELETSALL
jgi:hypothetical protein